MGRAPCCEKNGLKKGPWTAEEDQKLMDYIQKHGQGNWRTLPKNAGLSRCGKSCRLRWTNYLRPDIKRGRFSFEEEETIIQLHSLLGNKWSAIAARLPGRTDNEIKNYWNTHIRKRLLRMGIDPVTHSPRLDLLDLSSILGRPTIYNPTSHTIESIMNSELLRIATNLLSARHDNNPNSNYLMQDSLQEEELSNPQIQTQFQSFPTTQQEALILNDPHITQATATYMSQALPTCQQLQSNVNTNDASFGPTQNFTSYGLDQSINLDGLSSSLVYPNINNFSSVMSAPTSNSTPMNSATPTYLNSSTDEDGVSYCSTDMLNFQIPDLLELNDFM